MAKLMIARFPGGWSESPDTTDWIVKTVCQAKADPRIDDILNFKIDDTPITMGRNRCLDLARQKGVDYLLMIDSDMKPDAYLPGNPNAIGTDDRADCFFTSALAWLHFYRQKGKPAVIGAPYCGPPPHENVYVFRWEDRETGGPEDENQYSLEQYTRQEAARLTGIQEVAALPTGLIMIDMQALEKCDKPYTYYEWTDAGEQEKASTEDVTFTRDLSLMGVPLFCNWNAWCGHWKRKCVGRPNPLQSEHVAEKLRRTIIRHHERGNTRFVSFGNDRPASEEDTSGHDSGSEGNGSESGTHYQDRLVYADGRGGFTEAGAEADLGPAGITRTDY